MPIDSNGFLKLRYDTIKFPCIYESQTTRVFVARPQHINIAYIISHALSFIYVVVVHAQIDFVTAIICETFAIIIGAIDIHSLGRVLCLCAHGIHLSSVAGSYTLIIIIARFSVRQLILNTYI